MTSVTDSEQPEPAMADDSGLADDTGLAEDTGAGDTGAGDTVVGDTGVPDESGVVEGPNDAGDGGAADEGDLSEGAPATSETLVEVPRAPLRPALEAVLMVSDQPLDAMTLATAVGYPVDQVVAELQLLAEEYDEQGRGFELRNLAGGWRYYTREDYAPVVEAFVLEGQQARLTQAALETLAVVAYKQPVSRARVSAIRGVNVDGVMRTLLTRGLVEEAGSDESTGARLYRTTSYFLERIGVQSLDELPELAPYLPDLADVEDELEAVTAAGARPAQEAAEPDAPETLDAPAAQSAGDTDPS